MISHFKTNKFYTPEWLAKLKKIKMTCQEKLYEKIPEKYGMQFQH